MYDISRGEKTMGRSGHGVRCAPTSIDPSHTHKYTYATREACDACATIKSATIYVCTDAVGVDCDCATVCTQTNGVLALF
jgi:hypothetical protein